MLALNGILDGIRVLARLKERPVRIARRERNSMKLTVLIVRFAGGPSPFPEAVGCARA